MSAILIDTCSCKKKEIFKIKKKYSKLKKNHFTHRSFRNISCGLDVFYDIKMKAIYKLKKKHMLILTKKGDSKILKGNTLLQPVRWQASPIPTKK